MCDNKWKNSNEIQLVKSRSDYVIYSNLLQRIKHDLPWLTNKFKSAIKSI